MTGCNVLLSVGIVREARLKKEGGYRIPYVSQSVHLIRIGVNIIYGCDTIPDRSEQERHVLPRSHTEEGEGGVGKWQFSPLLQAR